MKRFTGDLLAEGDLVLRNAQPEDVAPLARWGADPEFARYQWASKPWTDPELAVRFLERFAAMTPSQGRLFIIDLEGRGPIGYVNYRDVRPKVRCCEVGIAIGERHLWSQGYGTRVMRLFLSYLFDVLGLHKVTLRVVAFNVQAIRAYEKCGFKREGLLRDAYWLEDRYWDSLLMAMLEDDWMHLKQEHEAATSPPDR